ncbi:hypothetical protein ACOBQJ_12965 [Pelotomaculum propionicicum]|uniref:hypothetical protein n=1 Tax=Pelotomaculum propionicicum TaxID=258475 RepID=UPI003B7CE785
MKITASDIVTAIGHLQKDRAYNYINPRTRTKIHIVHICYPEGPIIIKRYNPSKGENLLNAREESISTQMIWRVANAITPGYPVNIDRILGASYNTRSALETLLAHTAQFYYCYPGRIENINSSTEIKHGHKHIMWHPDEPHEMGRIQEIETDIVISEIPGNEAIYEALVLPEDWGSPEIDIDIKRRHAQIQVALILIGQQLDFRTWVAQNDKGIIYKDKKIGEMDGVISSLGSEKLLMAFEDAQKAARLIDCIWFKNDRLMPAVMEIEHSTGVTSGLSRMKTLQDKLPPFPTRYVVVAADEYREKVLLETTKEQFSSLNTRYFPYSAVEELYALCQKRKLRGITEEFLDCFMEPVGRMTN